MIKLVQCVRRQPGMSTEKFRQAWESYGGRVRAVAISMGAVGAKLSTTLETPVNQALTAARGSTQPYDGVAEIVWQRGSEVLASANEPAVRERIDELRRFQESFADVKESAFFFVHEVDVIEEP